MENKIISTAKLLEVIEALRKEEYTVTELATDYGGCYNFITQPDGTTGHVPVYDDAKHGTTPPVHRGVVNVCGLKFFYADAGIDHCEPDILLVDEDPGYDEPYENVYGCCNIELEDDSEDLVGIFRSIIKETLCTPDTWDDVPDDCLDDEAVDIEDCILIQDADLGSFDIDGVCYYIVDTEAENDEECEDDELTYVYAVPEKREPSETGCYDGVFLIGYRGELDSAEVVCAKEKDELRYNSVDAIVE